MNIGGTLDMAALARLHFSTLTHEEKTAAIRRLAASGQGVYTIAAATGLSVEQVRRILSPETT